MHTIVFIIHQILLSADRPLSAWPTQPKLALLDPPSKVLQVLAQFALRVGDDLGHELPSFATGWVSVA
jgi:hypothetical protein